MSYRSCNYTAFYVAEPFNQYNLGAYAAKDFCYYQALKAWKGKDSSFPFFDAHDKTYDVRDGSDWERTLKPRLHERLRVYSKNIILFLSSNTCSSRAIREEIDYGMCYLGLPVIVVYPELTQTEIAVDRKIKWAAERLWDNLPIFRDNFRNVPTCHVPLNKELITKALNDKDFTIQGKTANYLWSY